MQRPTELLYRFEAKGIQSYVLQSNKLRDMRGASAAVESLAPAAEAAILAAGGSIVQNAAGIGLARFPNEGALGTFAEAWPMAVSQLCPHLTMVQAWVPASGDEAASRAALFAAIEAARNKPARVLPEAGPFVARAGRTGRPAVARKEGEELDAALAVFRGAADQVDALAGRFGLDAEELEADLARWPEGYAAVVHIDGNGVGSRVAAQPLAALSGFSAALRNATQRAAQAAVAAVRAAFAVWRPPTPSGASRLPLRPIVLGGDDVTVLLHARLALPFVKAYLAAFEAETGRERGLGGKLTAAAGVAFVHRNFPFAQAHALAEDLCKAGKAASRTESTLLFHRVTTSVLDRWADIRESELAGGALAFGPYRLTSKPSLEGLERLGRAIRHSSTGRGALRGWVAIFQEERARGKDTPRATQRWARIKEVASGDPGDATWSHVEQALDELGNVPGSTPIYDALTLQSLGAVPARSES